AVLLLSLLGVADPGQSVCAEESQQAPAIAHLSTDAVLAEDGASWHVRLRFTTSVPTICHVTDGSSADTLKAGTPEIEALRNHRFDVAATLGKPHFIQIHGTAGELALLSDVIKVAPPKPFPT